jgi:hypothetical protein
MATAYTAKKRFIRRRLEMICGLSSMLMPYAVGAACSNYLYRWLLLTSSLEAVYS